jgi:hypothetical protein
MTGVPVFALLLLVLLGMAWGFRSVFLVLVAQSAERGNFIPVSLTLARVPVPAGETFYLSLPARRDGEGLLSLGSLVLTSRRVRLVRRGAVVVDVPLPQVEHLTVKGFTLRITVRGGGPPLVLRVAQPAAIARYIRCLAVRASGRAV